MRQCLPLALCLAAACAYPAQAQEPAAASPAAEQQAPAAQAKPVRSFQVEITGADDYRALLNEHLEIRRHVDDADLGEEEFRRLVEITPRQIQDLLATEGYFSPSVEHEIVPGERPLVRFRVRLGEATRISMVDIRFAGYIAQQQFTDRMNRLRRQWPLNPGERFRQDEWSSAKNNVLKNLLVQDYPAATVADSQARVDPERRIADLSIEYNSGPPFTFGELQVTGLQRYSRALIDELNPIRPGDPYSQEKLSELQSRLLDTGYFRNAFASVDIDPDHPENVPVRLDLAENPRKRLSFGTGFSTDAGVRIETKYLDRRFLDRNLRLESEALLDQKTRRLGGGLFFPALQNGWHPVVDARYERTDISGELLDTVRVGARVTSPIKTDEKSWGITYFADRQHVDTATNDRQALLASYSYTRRRLDNILNPRSGYVASLTLGAGPRGLINTTNIGRVLGNVNLLTQYGRRWQTVLRAQVGQILGASRFEVPSALLFRTGGDQTVRGYSYNTLGVPQGSAIVGGRVLGVASAEAIYWFRPEWGAAAFHDMGDATDSWRDFKLNHGTGVGARWRSPIGPVSVDIAYGHTTRKPRLHFSVGYGF